MLAPQESLFANGHAAWALFARTLDCFRRSLVWNLLQGAMLVGYFIALLFVEWTSSTIGAPGWNFYRSIAYLNFVLIAVAGTGSFSVCISSEREEGTLDLLRLSGLGTIGIMIGVWLPPVLATAILLILQIPCTSFAVTLGGVTPDCIRATMVATTVQLFFVASIGFLISVFSQTSGLAVIISLIIFGSWFAGPNVVESVLTWVWPGSGNAFDLFFDQLRQLSAFGSLDRISRTSRVGLSLWGPELTWQALIGVAALICGTFNLERQSAVVPVTKAAPKKAHSAHRWLQGLAALFDKDFSVLGGGWRRCVVRAVAYPTLSILYAGGMASMEWGRLFEGTAHLLAWDCAMVLSQLFQQEIHDRTWNSLLLLPYSLTGICYSKLVGAISALAPGWIWIMILTSLRFQAISIIEVCFYLSIIVFCCHLAVLFSVLIPRVSWTVPMILAVTAGNVTYLISQNLVFSLRFLGSHQDVMFRMLVVSLSLSVLAHGLTVARIRYLSD